jgi:hypothetical protein
MSLWIAYGYYLDMMGYIFSSSFQWIAYGLVLAFSYDLLQIRYSLTKEEPKIETYDMKSGIFPGAIAGIVTGFVASFANAILFLSGQFKLPGAPATLTLDFWLSQSGSHILFHIIWGIIFGAIFAKVYNLVPRKGIMKGLSYSLIIFLITTVQSSVYTLGYGVSYSNWSSVYIAIWGIFVGLFSTGIAYGIMIGFLYRKPIEAPSLEKEKIRTVQIINCRHCNEDIPKGSEYCNKCGKKQ